MKKDVVIIGAGCAGMVAALEAQAEGAEVTIIDRGPIGIGTNSALAGGIFTGPTPHYSPEEYVRDSLLIGRGINCESLVRLMAQEAPHAFSFLRSLGLDLVELHNGYAVRSPRPDTMAGVTLVRALAGKIRDMGGINVLTGLYVTEILNDEERIYGLRGFDKAGGEVVIYAPAIVLATGGAGAVYLRSDNQKGIMGQGYFLAAKAGVELWDMEFVQFYPFVIAEPGLPSLIVYPPRPQKAKLINAAGEDILRKHGIDDLSKGATMTRRDELSAILFREGLKGPISMDMRRLPDSQWERNPLRKVKFDFRSKPFAVAPAAHFFMGGVRIGEDGQTSLPGLFACGEAVWGIHGANRMGGNALTDCAVFGRIAGQNAARYAFIHRKDRLHPKGLPEEFSYAKSSAREILGDLRQRIREVAWRHAGVVRSENGLREGLAKLIDLERELKAAGAQGVSERRLREDLMSAIFVIKAVLTVSLSRKETRGAFIREDFAQQDDLNWRKNSCLAYDRGKDQFSHTLFCSPTG